MSDVIEIETALHQLTRQDKWRIAMGILEDLEENSHRQSEVRIASAPVPLPDYAARRRHIFGDKILPNMVLAAREEDRW